MLRVSGFREKCGRCYRSAALYQERRGAGVGMMGTVEQGYRKPRRERPEKPAPKVEVRAQNMHAFVRAHRRPRRSEDTHQQEIPPRSDDRQHAFLPLVYKFRPGTDSKQTIAPWIQGRRESTGTLNIVDGREHTWSLAI